MADDLDDVEPDPRTLAVPADATVHLRRADEARVTVDDFGPGSPTVAVMRQSWQGAMRSLTDLGEQVRAVTCERDGVREELGRMAGDLEDMRATLAVRDGELRTVTAEQDRLARAVDRAWALADQCVPWSRGATGRGGVTAGELRSALAVPTPDAPAGPLYAPVAAQEPPAGGIGPTEAQRGAEGDFANDPAVLAWAREHVERDVAKLRGWEQEATGKGEPERAMRWRRIANFLQREYVGGTGCVIAAFDERRPAFERARPAGAGPASQGRAGGERG